MHDDLISTMREHAHDIETAATQTFKLAAVDRSTALLRLGAKALEDVKADTNTKTEKLAFWLFGKLEDNARLWENEPALQQQYREQARRFFT